MHIGEPRLRSGVTSGAARRTERSREMVRTPLGLLQGYGGVHKGQVYSGQVESQEVLERRALCWDSARILDGGQGQHSRMSPKTRVQLTCVAASNVRYVEFRFSSSSSMDATFPHLQQTPKCQHRSVATPHPPQVCSPIAVIWRAPHCDDC